MFASRGKRSWTDEGTCVMSISGFHILVPIHLLQAVSVLLGGGGVRIFFGGGGEWILPRLLCLLCILCTTLFDVWNLLGHFYTHICISSFWNLSRHLEYQNLIWRSQWKVQKEVHACRICGREMQVKTSTDLSSKYLLLPRQHFLLSTFATGLRYTQDQ